MFNKVGSLLLNPVSTFLLEIGTEELPADFAREALPQLEQVVKRDLKQRRLSHGLISCDSTPRRIVLIVNDLASKASDLEEDRKGPPAKQAFENGLPTQAAVGFARKFGVDVRNLEVRETSKGSFVFVKSIEKGIASIDVLAELIPLWIGSLQGRRFMRWGNGERRFSRPIRWLVAMLGENVVPVCLTGTEPEIHAGDISRSHRLYGGNIRIPSADSYRDVISQVGVFIDRKARSDFISKSIYKASEKLSARPDLPENLFNELIDLVESPLLIQGKVGEDFLSLPAEVLSTVMKVHQRYVPLYREDSIDEPLALDGKDILLPTFLCIGNGLDSANEKVRQGNERVLKARLADADFFYKADLSVKSVDRCKELARVTFAQGLGTLFDRVSRIEWLTEELLLQISSSKLNANHARRAAKLCKHDLVSQMVGEFPELHGLTLFIGIKL